MEQELKKLEKELQDKETPEVDSESVNALAAQKEDDLAQHKDLFLNSMRKQ